jgi:hypothetical protein
MMARHDLFLPVFAAFIFSVIPLGAQEVISGDILPKGITSSSSEFPLWAQDLRRGEIVAFGSFPFTMFLSTFTMDSIRYFSHSTDKRYAPWPFKGPGAIEMTKTERQQTMIAAAVASVTIAIVDFAIVQVKRNKEAKRIQQQNDNRAIQAARITVDEEPEEFPPEEVPGETP